ncbi:MAG TPA: endo-1,4-beta-xylanase [Ktedonobacteraceae bacterium]|nr:endo-1,4-beta-xylanase [Ktedonobacteraceae bacterium]
MRSIHETLRHRILVSLLFLILLATSCGQASTQVPSSTPEPALVSPTASPTSTATLRSFAQTRGFYIGTAVNVGALLTEQRYSDILATEFNMVTPEVAMKFNATEPERGHYNFTDGDTLVAFASAHDMQVRGHNLVWFMALPSWLTTGHFTRNELMSILHDHIFAEVSHYRGEVNIWDVVNEAINDNGSLRDSIWSRGIGPDYLDLAFRWAHEANPQARLFYNDYGAEGLGQKSDAVYRLVAGMIKRGVPINGVGLQMHVSLDSYPRPQDVLANMRRLTALGLEVQITEMDVEIQNDPRPIQVRFAVEAQIYRDMLSTCLAVARCTAFVMWGFTDRHSWIPAATGHSDAPLIFDAAYQPKPAYYALLNVLQQN